jgi:Carbohydrate binding domain (family 25).
MPRTTKVAKENTDYVQKGVVINPTVPNVGEQVKVVYDGLLSKSGATHVYAHVGFGSRWDNLQDIPMMRTSTGFETTLPVYNADRINLAFKDCANNWDNNSGMNYSYDVTQ